jgi:hypothetical protein
VAAAVAERQSLRPPPEAGSFNQLCKLACCNHPLLALHTCAVLLDEGERGAHNMDRAEAWLAAVPPLFPLVGLQLTAHFGRLMPLLLGWCLGPRWSVRCTALEALLEVVRLTWQRMGVHAATVWRVLRRVHEDEQKRRWVKWGAD